MDVNSTKDAILFCREHPRNSWMTETAICGSIIVNKKIKTSQILGWNWTKLLWGKKLNINRNWNCRDVETEGNSGKNVRSHGYLRNVDSVHRKKKRNNRPKLLQLRESYWQPPWIRPTADQLIWESQPQNGGKVCVCVYLRTSYVCMTEYLAEVQG